MQKLILEPIIEENNFSLIGIHCAIPDYRLAFLLNKYLQLNLIRLDNLCFSDNTSFSFFEWEDQKKDCVWNLIANTSKHLNYSLQNKDSLFSEEVTFFQTKYLVSEYKKANYILKITDDYFLEKEKYITRQILNIPQIITAYAIPTNKLKTTDQFLFH